MLRLFLRGERLLVCIVKGLMASELIGCWYPNEAPSALSIASLSRDKVIVMLATRRLVSTSFRPCSVGSHTEDQDCEL